MSDAVKHVLGEHAEIRIDIDKHPYNETWIEERAKEDYDFLKPYMDQEQALSTIEFNNFLASIGL